MNRFFWVSCLLLCLFGLIVYRLFDLAVFERPFLLHIAKRQHKIVIELEPKRGNILDRQGQELATTVKSPSIYAIPRLIKKKGRGELAAQVAQILNLDPFWTADRLSRDKAFVWLKRKVGEEDAESILALGNPYVAVQNEYKRFYPHSSELANVLGFCSIDSQGLEGLELAFDSSLRGEKGLRESKRDALGREVPALEEKVIPPVNGQDLVLHIDNFIQHVVERELDKSYTKWHAKGACAIVMDPQTGHILAMANRPAFDANAYQKSNVESRRNRCLTDFYEPGSIFKIVTMAAALSEKKVKLEDSFFCENGTWHISSKRVIHDVHPYGRLLLPEILIKSSNIGTVKVAKLIGEERLHHYIKKFGFGEMTGIEIQGEVSGIVHPLEKWSKISITSVPYGQEVTATALQMVRALAVVANGGYLVKPQIVKEVRDEFGVTIKAEAPPVRQRIIEPEVASMLSDILVKVVEEGTGQTAKIKGVRVAGKTGTAQKLNPGGGYSHTNFIGSFMGFAPAENPMLCMIVMIDDPHPSYYGGTVAAPVFKAAMEESLLHLGYVPPPPQAKEIPKESVKATVGVAPPSPALHQ